MSIARGILSGFLKEGLEQKAARDEMYADMVKEAGAEFRKTAQLFRQQEKNIEENFKSVELAHGLPAALYASYNNAIDTERNTKIIIDQLNKQPDFLKKINDLYDTGGFQNYDFNTEKTQRFMNFKDQQKDVLDLLGKNQFPVPVAELAFKDMKAMDTGTQVTRPELQLPDLTMGSGTYNFDTHGTERREFINFFNRTFRNPVSGAPEINVGPSDARYDLQQSLKQGFEEAKKNKFVGGEYLYMMNKFVDGEFKKQGITGYPTGFPKAIETKKTEATAQDTKATQDTKAFTGSEKLFKAPDTSQIGLKEDAKINILSKRTMEGGGSSSAAVVINSLRDIIARISDSPSLSDDEKTSRIDIARSRAKERLKAMGLDPDNFNL